MSVKTTGAEYKAYIESDDPVFWPDGSWMDDDELIVNGVIATGDSSFDAGSLADTDEVIIEAGSYFKSIDDDEGCSLVSHFKRWRKAQTTVRIAVEVHRDKLEELKALIKAAGGKVSA